LVWFLVCGGCFLLVLWFFFFLLWWCFFFFFFCLCCGCPVVMTPLHFILVISQSDRLGHSPENLVLCCSCADVRKLPSVRKPFLPLNRRVCNAVLFLAEMFGNLRVNFENHGLFRAFVPRYIFCTVAYDLSSEFSTNCSSVNHFDVLSSWSFCASHHDKVFPFLSPFQWDGRITNYLPFGFIPRSFFFLFAGFLFYGTTLV